jgi:hypothetical protein
MESNQQEEEKEKISDAQMWTFIIVVLLICGAIGFWIGRGTAPKETDLESYKDGYTVGKANRDQCFKYATTTITIVEEKQKCDKAGGILDIRNFPRAGVATSGEAHTFYIKCSLPQKTVFEFEVK